MSNPWKPLLLLGGVLAACGGAIHQGGSGPPVHPSASTGLKAGLNSPNAPGTWFLAGSAPAQYQMAGDPTGATPDSLTLSSTVATTADFGTAMTEQDPSAHFGKRVQLTAVVRAQDAAGWAGLWMRVDGPNGSVLAFDNMSNRPLSGTVAAQSYSVVLDVDATATNLAYGVLLVGSGTATVSSLAVQEVPTTVASTNLLPAPGQWLLAGSDPADYQTSGDPTGSAPDSLTLSSTTAPQTEFGTAMTDVDPTPYLSKRVRLRATVRTQNATGWAGLWMRVDGQGTQPLAFDNMQNRPLTGTQAAASYDVVLDVDPSAINLAYGVLLAGPGLATVSALTVDVVDTSVPTTN